MLGQTLNQRYTIVARLGKGAMGEVYRATDAQTGQDVAVKIITRDLALDPEMLERFRREGEALRQLRHANIVALVDTFAHAGQQVIVMEYIAGGSLHARIQRGPLPAELARRLALELADALARAHHLGIIHRDLKPENILLAEDDTPRLTDFGLVRLVGESARLTGTGMQMGTPYYMAPEAWQGQPLDAQADIWSLGVVLYEMLAGQVPFGGETLVAVMNRVLTAPLPDIKNLRPDAPPALVKIIQRMLMRDKARRYQSMREVALDLERATTTRPTLPPTRQAPSRKALPRWAWVAGAALGLGLVCLLAGVWAGQAALPQVARLWASATPTFTAAPTLTPAPAATATLEPAPTAADTPTPQSTAAPSVLYQENFDGEQRWSTITDAYSSRRYSGGRYILTVGQYVSTAPPSAFSTVIENFFFDGWSLAGQDVRNAAIEVEAQMLSGSASSVTYGIIFNYLNNYNFDFYEISPAGQWDLVAATGGQHLDQISFQAASAIRQDSGVNRMRVELGAQQLKFYINDVPVSATNLPATGGDVGVLVTNNSATLAEVAFDNFSVTPLK